MTSFSTAGILTRQTQIGALGYPFYVPGLFYFDRKDVLAYPIAASVVLGLCAGQLFAGVNYIALAYADEQNKGKNMNSSPFEEFSDSCQGRFYATQAALKVAGNLLGSSVVLGITAPGKRKSGGVPTAVYIAFIVIMLVATIFALLLCKPKDVRRKDDTALAVFKES